MRIFAISIVQLILNPPLSPSRCAAPEADQQPQPYETRLEMFISVTALRIKNILRSICTLVPGTQNSSGPVGPCRDISAMYSSLSCRSESGGKKTVGDMCGLGLWPRKTRAQTGVFRIPCDKQKRKKKKRKKVPLMG